MHSDFLGGTWLLKFSELKDPPKPDEWKRYVYEKYQSKRIYWRAFIEGAATITQEEIESMSPLQFAILQEALDDREKYRREEVLPRALYYADS